MDRRDFIKLTAVTGTTTALASCGGGVENELIRFVPDDDIIPGIAEWKPSVCPVCSAGCGMNVRVMDADVETTKNGQKGVVRMMVAKKLEGLATDKISRGGLCARGQAAIQITYHPDRLTQPMKRTGARGSGEFKPISWDEAIKDLVEKLDALVADGDQKVLVQKPLVYLTRPRRGRRAALVSEFAGRFGGAIVTTFEPFGDDVLRRANGASFGHEQMPTFDLDRSRYVVSFGADFLGTWGSVVAQNAAYGEFRQGRPGVRGKLVQVESRMTTTGASADEWVPCRSGTEGILALGLAHVIAGKSDEYTPEYVEKTTGVSAKRVERLAREIAAQKPAVAILGGPALAHTNATFTARAVNALNEALGAVGQPGGIFFTPGPSPVDGLSLPGTQASVSVLANAKVLLLDDANPVYGAPKAWKVREALAKIPYIASFGSFIDDTSANADLILPDHSFLESWVDRTAESGSIDASTIVAGPVMKPIHDTRATVDVLIDVAGRLKSPIALSWKAAEEVAKSAADPKSTNPQSAVRNPQSKMPSWTEPQFDGDAAAYPFHFLPYASPAFGDGSSAHLPWLQELPDPMVSAMWSSWIEINPKTAEQLRVAQGDIVDVTSTQGTLRAPVFVSPAIAPDVVAMPMGQGHEHFTRYASGRGVNPVTILAPMTESETGALAWAATRVKVVRAADADGSLIMFGAEMRESPHEHEIR